MELKKIHISDIGKVVTGKTPRTSIVENYGGNIPFLTPSDDLSYKSVPKTSKTLTEQGLNEVKNCLLPPHSVCVSCIGSDLGKVVMTLEPTITNQQFNSIIPNRQFNTDFVYYLMTLVGKELNYLSKTSTAVPIINKSSFSNYEVEVPDLKKQEKIASILSSLDDKIELNRRINGNLEQQAQALFKAWFVDFEPFKDGKFVDSELGMIPEGWKVGNLSDIANITMGQSPDGKSYNECGDGMIFYQGRAEFGYRFPYVRLYTTQPKKIAEPLSILLSVRAPVGDINIAYYKCCIGRGLAAIQCTNKCQSFLFYLIQSLKPIFNQYNGEGTVFGSISKEALSNIRIVIPKIEVINRFESIAKNIDRLILQYFLQIKNLESLRDTLLPRLMSGELNVNTITE